MALVSPRLNDHFDLPLSLAAAAPVAALTGIEIVAIVAVAFLGITLVLIIGKEYKKVSIKGGKGDANAELVLERA